MDYVRKRKIQHAIKLIEKAQEEEKREIQYRLWLVRYPLYTEENYETFEEFYEKTVPKKVDYDLRPKEEIMNEILNKS